MTRWNRGQHPVRRPVDSRVADRWRRRCVLALMVTPFLAACTASTHTSAPRSSAHGTAVPTTSTTNAATVRNCTAGSVRDLTPSGNDITAGPVVFGNMKLASSAAGLRDFYGNGQVPDAPGGARFYKMGVQVKANATVVISVAPKAMNYLRLQQGQSPVVPQTAFTFHACPGTGYTGWVGGFDIKGGLPACIALDVQVTGESARRQLNIPFGGPTCD